MFSVKMDDQFFVEHYDVLGEENMRKDSVDDKLNCIRLKWERNGGHEEAREYGKVFTLCPSDSVRGCVYIVQANAVVELLNDTFPYKAAVLNHLRTSEE